jgi:hypothetical protein
LLVHGAAGDRISIATSIDSNVAGIGGCGRADIRAWTPIEYDLVYTKMDRACAHEPFLAAFCEAVKEQSEAKMRAAGIDVETVKQRLATAS